MVFHISIILNRIAVTCRICNTLLYTKIRINERQDEKKKIRPKNVVMQSAQARKNTAHLQHCLHIAGKMDGQNRMTYGANYGNFNKNFVRLVKL